MTRARRVSSTGLALLLFCSAALLAQDQEQGPDPPSRVARLNYINGSVSMQPEGVNDWAPAELNRPFTVGDYLYTDQGGTAELHLDIGAIRMGSQTSFGFLNLDDRTVQLKLSEGDLSVRVRNLGGGQVFEVDTPNAAVNLLRDGSYRFRVDPNGNMSFVVVRDGQAEVTGGGQAFTLNPGNSATLNGTDQLAYDIEAAPQEDEFDQWVSGREAHEARLESSRYLPPSVVGYEDLDDYGSWQDSQQYGAVWYPRSVDSDWAPYRNGHWAWIDPWGWTWVDAAPWGFAPFHYGRWAYIGNRWGWCPGPISVSYRGPVVRPYYAPAMVAWFGGSNFHVGISIGGGPSLGWVPLGWGEVYTPAYHCSPRYFNNVNVYNTRVVNNVNITNVYNTVYVNKQVYNQQYVNVRAPRAVAAMPQAAFASGRPVRQAAVAVQPAQFAQLRSAAVVRPGVAPTRQSYLAASGGRSVARPMAQVVARPVVARTAPPPARANAFASTRPIAGQPMVAPRTASPNVRVVPAVTPVAVRPGQRVGAVATQNRVTPTTQPAARVGVSGPAEQPAGRATTPANAGQPAARQNGQFSPVAPRTQPQTPQQRQTPSIQQSQPAEVPQQQTPAAHGVPPNMRRANPNYSNQSDSNGRFSNRAPEENPGITKRTSPATNAPGTRPQPAERSQPYTPQRTIESQRPSPQSERQAQQPRTPAYPERNTPAPRPQISQPRVNEAPVRSTPTPAPRPQISQPQVNSVPRPQVSAPQERPQPPAARAPQQERPQPQERQQPQERPQRAAPANHGNDHDRKPN